MRKILFLSLLLTVMAAYSRQISPEEASGIAADFLNGPAMQRTVPAKAEKARNIAGSNGNSPYYVFNSSDGKGFVIVSGDDRAPRVLGYSDRGSFDYSNMPPQLKALLAGYTEKLQSLPDVRHSSWSNGASRAQESGVLLPTPNWGQGYPYNTECPTIGDEHTLTGCVATAMAIVMKYHNWPEGYDWAAMPMNTEEDPINFEEGNDLPALAKIMHDAGEAVFMQYGLEESGAYLDWIGHRLQSVFHYSPDCQYIGGDHFEKDEWVKMLKGNLDKGNPVIYDGYGSGGHHAFVLDGYDSADMYHVNWGWNGLDNGYYALDALDPVEGWGFSEYNGMIMNIEPDREMSDYSECFTDYGYLWAVGVNRRAAVMNVSVEDVKKGEPFHLFNSNLTITPGFKGQVGVAIVDAENNIKEVLRTEYRTTFQPGTTNTQPDCYVMRYYDLVATCDIEPGDRIQLVSKHDDDDRFKIILGTMEWPSSKPALGNVPESSTIIFNVPEGLHCSYRLEKLDSESVDLPLGITEIPTHVGAFYSVFFNKIDSEDKNPIQIAIHGNMYGGDSEYWTTYEPMSYPIEIYGEKYEVEFKILDLKDETVHLEAAGTLKDKMAGADGINIGSLTVNGKMNALDFWYIRDNFPNIQHLDLKGVEIEEVVAGDGEWVSDGMTHPANAIPYRALPGLVNLERIVLPESLTSIEGFSLMAMKLSSITIPAGVSSIGTDAFWGNEELMVVEVLNPEPPVFDRTPFEYTQCPANGILFVPEGTVDDYKKAELWSEFSKIVEGPMPDPLKATVVVDNLVYECFVDEATLIGYEGEPVDVVIPETLTVNGTNYTVTSIKESCFSFCNSLRSIEMPNSIAEIGYQCFSWCENLESVKLSPRISRIEYETFRMCENLREFEITPNIEYLGNQALYGAGISSLFIPKTCIPDPYSLPFGNNANLEKFEVEEGHEYYKEDDGLLYRISENGLLLESVPGAKSGVVATSADCTEIMNGAFSGLDKVTGIVFNDGLRMIPQYAVQSNRELAHITLPAGVTILEDAIRDNMSLESVTFNGTPTIFSPIFSYCPLLTHIYVNGEETVDVNGLFADEYENLNFYNPSLEKTFDYSGAHTIFVPGAAKDMFEGYDSSDIVEMWEYSINRQKNILAITPAEGVEIERVTINGRIVAGQNNVYSISEEPQDSEVITVSDTDPNKDLDVTVNYKVHGRQSMVTHYTPEFNATIPDNVTTGAGSLLAAPSGKIDVFTLDGAPVSKNSEHSILNQLEPGIYVIRQAGESRKIKISK